MPEFLICLLCRKYCQHIPSGPDHGEGWETRYAHCWEIKARAGAKVRPGQVVALVGNTGRSFGPHLHFEVRRGGQPIDPLTCSAV